MMRIKKLAIAATVLLGAGALGLVIANRAVAVGGAQLQELRSQAAIRLVEPSVRTAGQSERGPRCVTATSSPALTMSEISSE